MIVIRKELCPHDEYRQNRIHLIDLRNMVFNNIHNRNAWRGFSDDRLA